METFLPCLSRKHWETPRRKENSQLAEGAFKFYQRPTSPYLLSIAAEWCEKALELHKTPEILDIYAKLLYKPAKNEKAIDEVKEAIEIQQKRGYPTRLYDMQLEAMKNEKLL